jgi:hypothetical protein
LNAAGSGASGLASGVKRDAARILQEHNAALADLLQRFQKGLINLLGEALTFKNRLRRKLDFTDIIR